MKKTLPLKKKKKKIALVDTRPDLYLILRFLCVPLEQRFSNCGGASLVGNRDVTGGARQTGGNFPFYALYGNVRSNLPESGARPRTRLESDCGVCVCVCVQHVISVSFLYSWLQMKCLTF